MKPLTSKKPLPASKNDKAPGRAATEPRPRVEAQCCAKTSRTVAGCHD